MARQYNDDPGILNNSDELLNLYILKSNKTGNKFCFNCGAKMKEVDNEQRKEM